MANIVPTKTLFVVTPDAGAMDTRNLYGVEPPPPDATAPDWVANMVVGTWYAISGDTPDSATLGLSATTAGTRYAEQVQLVGGPNMGFQDALMYAWNSGAYVPTLGTAGSMCYWGGGHAAYQGNEILRFDLATREWSRVSGPSVVGPQGDGTFPLWPNPDSLLADPGLYPDGTPAPPHTDAVLQYAPSVNALICFKAVQALGGTSSEGVGTFLRAYWYEFDNDIWRYSSIIDPDNLLPFKQGGAVWVEALGQFIICPDPNDDTWVAFDPATGPNGDGTYGTWGTVYDRAGTISQDIVIAHDPVAGKLVIQDFRAARIRIKADTGPDVAFTTLTLPVGLPYQTPTGRQVGGHPWDWSGELGGIVYQQDQTPNVYLITSDDDWSSCSYSTLTVDANGAESAFVTGVGINANPLYQRCRTIEYGSTVLQVGVALTDSAVWAMRLR